MMQNVEAELEQICLFTKLAWNDEVGQNMKALNKTNKQHKYGVHSYALSDFNLSEEAVNQAFKPYSEQFNILHE